MHATKPPAEAIVPAALPAVAVMRFSFAPYGILRNGESPRKMAKEMTAAVMEAPKVQPIFRPMQTFDAPMSEPTNKPEMTARRVNSDGLRSMGRGEGPVLSAAASRLMKAPRCGVRWLYSFATGPYLTPWRNLPLSSSSMYRCWTIAPSRKPPS